MAVITVDAHAHISLPASWGALGATAPGDDADADTLDPSNYIGAHGNIRIQYLDADMGAKSDTALADIFPISVEASGVYAFEYSVFYVVAASTTGLSLAMNGPTIGAGWITYGALEILTAVTAGGSGKFAYEDKITTTASLVAGSVAVLSGMFEAGSTAGDLALRYSPEVAASLTVKKGSWGRITKLN